MNEKKREPKWLFSMQHKGIDLYSECDITAPEATEYIEKGLKQHGDNLDHVEIVREKGIGNYRVEYNLKEYPKFYHTRRITGYLVGDTSRWNDAKKAELKDRVKHGVEA